MTDDRSRACPVQVQQGDELVCNATEHVAMLLDSDKTLKRFYKLTKNESFLLQNCPVINYAQLTENNGIMQCILNMINKVKGNYLHCTKILKLIYKLNGIPTEYTCIECKYYIPNAGNTNSKQ